MFSTTVSRVADGRVSRIESEKTESKKDEYVNKLSLKK